VAKTKKECWDCGTQTSDFVREERSVGGGGNQIEDDRGLVPVCNNRKECLSRQKHRADQEEYCTFCPICKQKFTYRRANEKQTKADHLSCHSSKVIFDYLVKKWPY
jgi:hypothetical protein